MNLIKMFFSSLSYIFFPPSCVICGEFSEFSLCPDCKSKIDFIENFHHCGRCSLILPGNMDCPDCSNSQFHFSRLISIFSYSGYGEIIIRKIKFDGKLFVLHAFSDEIQKRISGVDFDIVVPVPSFISKFVKRGYNPSFSIAYFISKIFSKPYVFALEKVKNTPSQLDIPREKRILNTYGAFFVVKDVKGRKVFLVDDVATTCSTLSECSRILKEAGAYDVVAFSLSRTPFLS